MNFGSMNGRSREVADVMERRVDILCVQKTKWRGNKAKDIGNGYNLLHSRADETGRSSVGIVISKEMKENIVGTERKSERLMKLRLCCRGHILNVVSAYAPQTRCIEDVKKKFWRDMDEVMTSTEVEEMLVVGGDWNGHIGCNRENIIRKHGGHGMGEINEEGELITDFALAFEMIKDKNGRVSSKEESIIARWKEYFGELLNEESPRTIIRDGNPHERIVQDISREEVKKALDKMKKGKAVGPDGIPAEILVVRRLAGQMYHSAKFGQLTDLMGGTCCG
ncbi:craniofacial development protein 2-like [Macrobrachium nipponense]|uniref:craniofacial development protein 2-like n=1 Tax=Macrobrachium nipponense TaxID=159736 RepID=UPI0030C7A66E